MTEDQLIDAIIARESPDYTNRPGDRGGPTKFGISRFTLGAVRNTDATEADVQALTRSEAVEVYRQFFLPPWSWIPDETVRVICIDWGVTSTRPAVIKGLQMAIGGLLVDGVAGPKTRAACTEACTRDPVSLAVRLRHARCDYYCRLALNNDDISTFYRQHPDCQLQFLKGWIHRATEV